MVVRGLVNDTMFQLRVFNASEALHMGKERKSSFLASFFR
jgi:hypothetical protein